MAENGTQALNIICVTASLSSRVTVEPSGPDVGLHIGAVDDNWGAPLRIHMTKSQAITLGLELIRFANAMSITECVDPPAPEVQETPMPAAPNS